MLSSLMYNIVGTFSLPMKVRLFRAKSHRRIRKRTRMEILDIREPLIEKMRGFTRA